MVNLDVGNQRKFLRTWDWYFNGEHMCRTGPKLSANGFLQSVSAVVCRKRPPKDQLQPPSNAENSNQSTSNGSSNAPNSIQNTPPEQVTIKNEGAKRDKLGKPEMKEDGTKPVEAAKPKKPAHMKRVSSAGLQMELVLGRKTGNLKEIYSLGRKLGQGQFGTTFLCIEKASGKEYACKSIAKRKLTTEEDVRREIQIMHHLAGHSYVIQITYKLSGRTRML